MEDEKFRFLVEQNAPTGEVIASNDFLITVRGLTPVGINAVVRFSDGNRGIVHRVDQQAVTVLSMSRKSIQLGTLAAVETDQVVANVGEGLLGRVVSVHGEPLDGKGDVLLTDVVPAFAEAPALIEREILNEQLPTGVTVVDTLFPIVLGQRIAVLGDSKSGKTTFLLQVAKNQKGTGRITIFALVAKRPTDISYVISELQSSGVLESSIVFVSSIFDSLADSYLLPYVACATAEYFWHQGRDVVLMYDDLSNHAQVHREMSLLAGVSPGRDSYPGDTFFTHSSLLERAGKLKSNSKTLTVIPTVLTPNNDATAYLPTNIISITDGQIIFDIDIFRKGMRPAVNTGLSVSRVGGRAKTDRAKEIAKKVFQKLSDFAQAEEFSHFASELALEAQRDLVIGERILEILKQRGNDLYSIIAQELMLHTAMSVDDKATIDLEGIKKQAIQLGQNAAGIDQAEFDNRVKQLIEANLMQTKI